MPGCTPTPRSPACGRPAPAPAPARSPTPPDHPRPRRMAMPADPPPPTDPADAERRSRLSRRYRRWLLAYPRAFRRERGPEVLGTLLDLSEGRDRPARRQVTSLLYRGLVTRFALGRRTVLVAVLAALLVGVSGISLGA